MKRIRVLVCGDSTVGKSSIILRFSKNKFEKEANSTIAAAFHSQFVQLHNEVVNLEIWDTAGSERYQSVITSFFHNAAVIVIVYDITSRTSFQNLDGWCEMARQNAPPDIPIIIAGNKVDLEKQRDIKYDEGKQYVDTKQLYGFVETSAKTGESIDLLFTQVASVPPNAVVESTSIQDVKVLDKNSCCK